MGLRDDAAGRGSRRRGVVVVELPRRARRRVVEQVGSQRQVRNAKKLRRYATSGAVTFLACPERYKNDARWRIL